MDRKKEIIGILVFLVSLFVMLSLVTYDSAEEPTVSPNIAISNRAGIIGVYIGHFLIKMGVGYVSFILPVLGAVWGWLFFSKKEVPFLPKLTVHGLLLALIISISFGLSSVTSLSDYEASGFVGATLAKLLHDFLGSIGTVIFLLASTFVLIRGYFNWNFYDPVEKLGALISGLISGGKNAKEEKSLDTQKREHTSRLLEGLKHRRESEEELSRTAAEEIAEQKEAPKLENKTVTTESPTAEPEVTDETVPAESPSINEKVDDEDEKVTEAARETEQSSIADDSSGDYTIEEEVIEQEIDFDAKVESAPKRSYQLPSVDYLDHREEVAPSASDSELVEKADFLTQSLSTFGVEGNVVNIAPGPVITLFEVEPAEGVRVNKFVQLSDDLARVMKAPRVRVIAPIPGKSSVGIEIPNENPSVVYMRSVINSGKFVSSTSKLTVALGKTTSGENFVIELDKLPHLLIAGTTGSGKSVCINTIISSLLYRSTPEEVRFILIDPKKLEMAAYRSLEKHHLITAEDIDEYVVTTPENAVLALRAAEKEMSRRYDVLAEAVVRNIHEFREKAEKDDSLETMPYIVVIIDELADLMLRAPKEVEQSIARLAQMARAVGIHLVLATQRPSVDVITGVIKANFPARIAFQVATKIDSRTIIDINGAEKLLGRGDMLFLPPGSSDPTRLHNSFVTLEEITKIVSHVESQPTADGIQLQGTKTQIGIDGEFSEGSEVQDELLPQAIRLVVTHQQGSISLLQRRFSVGYSRAARLIDQMEQLGIVGPFTGSKARQVLVDESYLQVLDDEEQS
ncbi:MAG: cell division protein FtsK [Candidatus Marinimicrobia bacterium]|nr:cell division protein FtsK [Candidatus Neomarinimicrobiota bacterium]|tara:strand:- start:5745 stop:8141 length:2397 start_codon:yes stop_codon:yes gene_type:complete